MNILGNELNVQDNLNTFEVSGLSEYQMSIVLSEGSNFDVVDINQTKFNNFHWGGFVNHFVAILCDKYENGQDIRGIQYENEKLIPKSWIVNGDVQVWDKIIEKVFKKYNNHKVLPNEFNLSNIDFYEYVNIWLLKTF